MGCIISYYKVNFLYKILFCIFSTWCCSQHFKSHQLPFFRQDVNSVNMLIVVSPLLSIDWEWLDRIVANPTLCRPTIRICYQNIDSVSLFHQLFLLILRLQYFSVLFEFVGAGRLLSVAKILISFLLFYIYKWPIARLKQNFTVLRWLEKIALF